MINIARNVASSFTAEFVQHPYLCYTEHGQHAYFYQLLYDSIPADQRLTTFKGQKVCVIQKEYPTPTNLGKSQRQHWDISIIKSPTETLSPESIPYDFLRLDVVIEFGMNADLDHLPEDIRRMTHESSNIGNMIAIHLYRLGEAADKLSRRDISQNSALIATFEQCIEWVGDNSIDLYYAVYNPNGTSQAWHYRDGISTSLLDA